MTAHMTDEDREQADRERDQQITILRKQLVIDLAAALNNLHAAEARIRELSSNHVYDIEWAEGGGPNAAASNLLLQAINNVYGAKAIASVIATQ